MQHTDLLEGFPQVFEQLLAVVSPNGPPVPSAVLNSLRLLLQVTSSGVAVSRLPGLAVYYTDTLKGLPQVFEQLLATAPTLHKAVVFLHIRQVHPNPPSYRPLLLLHQRHHAFSSFFCSRMTLLTHIQLSLRPHIHPLSSPSYPAGPWHAGSASCRYCSGNIASMSILFRECCEHVNKFRK